MCLCGSGIEVAFDLFERRLAEYGVRKKRCLTYHAG